MDGDECRRHNYRDVDERRVSGDTTFSAGLVSIGWIGGLLPQSGGDAAFALASQVMVKSTGRPVLATGSHVSLWPPRNGLDGQNDIFRAAVMSC